MTDFTIYTEADHPEHAAEIIAQVKAKYGFVPALMGAMAEAPAAAEGYLALGDAIAKTAFSPTERHVVWFTVNAYHECHYCMAAHTAIAKNDRVADDVIEAARNGDDYSDPKLQALKVFTTKMLDNRGWVAPADVDAFIAAGFTRQSVLDVVLVIAHKTLSNYTNHLVQTPVDAPFKPFAWQPQRQAAE